MILFSHPLSTAFTREAALALEEAGLLEELWTCLHWRPGGPVGRVLPGGVARELGRRSYPAAVWPKVHTHPWREAGRLLAGRLPGLRSLARHETGPCSVDAVFHDLDRVLVSRVRDFPAGVTGTHGVYAYEDGALDTFRAAKERGWRTVYDLPIGYWRAGQRLFAEEAERVPEWAVTLTGRNDSEEKLARKDAEIAASDAVIVASSFTRQTLQEAPGLRAPMHVVPYGAPSGLPFSGAATRKPPRRAGEPLRVMFAGSLGQRKGLSYLLEAVATLGKRVELTLLGLPTTRDCAPLNAALRTHRWVPSLPHAGVLSEMARQDVLVFPSLFEGFGLVLLEAMSQGVTVITTAHTAGPDLLEEGSDGFVVPVRSATAIAEKLDLLAAEPERCEAMGEAALRKATACSWQAYRAGIIQAVQKTLAG